MKRISKRKLEGCRDTGGAVLSDVRYESCVFESCQFSITTDPSDRSVMEGLEFINCSVRGSAVETAIVRDVVVEGLTTHGIFQTWGAVFERTILRGMVGSVMVSPVIQPGVASRQVQLAFDDANREFYASVDWALDITEAEVKELDLRGVPGHLVRRDPETQVLVTREAVLEGRWRDLPLEHTYWPVALDNLVLEGHESCVLVAPKRDRNYNALLEGLHVLRDAGVAS